MKHQIKSQSNSVPKYGDLGYLEILGFGERDKLLIRAEQTWEVRGRRQGQGYTDLCKVLAQETPTALSQPQAKEDTAPSKEKRDWGCFKEKIATYLH